MTETFEYISTDEASTVALGQKLAQIAKVGDVFALFGTLGMGKSVLARAFIQSLSGAEEVPSPTFTLVQSYDAPDFEIFHYDLYRIKSPEEIFEIGVEEAMYDGVCLVEWPDKMRPYLPRDSFRVEIIAQGNSRQVKITVTSEEKASRLEKLQGFFS